MKKEKDSKNTVLQKVATKYKSAVRRHDERKLINAEFINTSSAEANGADEPIELVAGGIDRTFLMLVIAILIFGSIMSFSASSVYAELYYDQSTYYLQNYILFASISIIMTIAVLWVFKTPERLKIFAISAYALSIFLLMLVPVIGTSGGGAKRWISLGFFTIQPSEIAKMAVIMMLALYMSRHEKEITSPLKWHGNFKCGVIVPFMVFGSVCMLVALEKHISGLLIIGMIGVAVMFFGGTRLKWLAIIFGTIAFCGLVLIVFSEYAQDRVLAWINIEADPLGSSWQTLQGLYAIGSGGFFGLGLGNSRQKFGYVSQPQNDFVFTIICEELGFIGALIVIGLFAVIVWRGFKIARNVPDKFCSLVVYGLTFKLALQAALNIAVVTNSIPNTGISLPFFSSGGTSLAIQIFEMGIILAISRYATISK